MLVIYSLSAFISAIALMAVIDKNDHPKFELILIFTPILNTILAILIIANLLDSIRR